MMRPVNGCDLCLGKRNGDFLRLKKGIKIQCMEELLASELPASIAEIRNKEKKNSGHLLAGLGARVDKRRRVSRVFLMLIG